MNSYYKWHDFKNVYLEDSFVLEIDETDDELSFILEVVLTENHPLYTPPNSDKQYCYKKGEIVFQELQSVKWINRNTRPFIDANGSEDYGNIDFFTLSPEGYHLSGDWGEIVVKSSPVKFIFREQEDDSF